MGYGHLRAAHAIARALGCEVFRIDREPLADERDRRGWNISRILYEGVCRASQVGLVRRPLQSLLEALTGIPPLHGSRNQSVPTRAVRLFDRLVEEGLGRGLVERLEKSRAPLVTTFYAPALIADRAGYDRIYCVVTDADIHRIWAPPEPARSRIRYLVPTARALERLRAYGVPEERLHFTGFPLPIELSGAAPELRVARRHLAERLLRLDPKGRFRTEHPNAVPSLGGAGNGTAPGEPPLLTFAVGGAGAQAELARHLLEGVREPVSRGALRLALVAGVRAEVAARFRRWREEAGLEEAGEAACEIVHERSVEAYLDRFHAILARSDVLWTKPSEMTFFAALGIPLVLMPPVGGHERYNRAWVLEHGAAVDQRDPRRAGEWITELLHAGTLAGAAWSGFTRLPAHGTWRILEAMGCTASGEMGSGRHSSSSTAGS